jgi:hypothetical protein
MPETRIMVSVKKLIVGPAQFFRTGIAELCGLLGTPILVALKLLDASESTYVAYLNFLAGVCFRQSI